MEPVLTCLRLCVPPRLRASDCPGGSLQWNAVSLPQCSGGSGYKGVSAAGHRQWHHCATGTQLLLQGQFRVFKGRSWPVELYYKSIVNTLYVHTFLIKTAKIWEILIEKYICCNRFAPQIPTFSHNSLLMCWYFCIWGHNNKIRECILKAKGKL